MKNYRHIYDKQAEIKIKELKEKLQLKSKSEVIRYVMNELKNMTILPSEKMSLSIQVKDELLDSVEKKAKEAGSNKTQLINDFLKGA